MRNMMTHVLTNWCIGLCVALLMMVGCVEGKSLGNKVALAEKQAVLEEKAGVDNATPAEIQSKITPNKFTQSEAHFQLEDVKKIFQTYPASRIVPYFNIIAECLVKEADLKDSHYVFYHAMDNGWRTPQDLYKRLFTYFNPQKTAQDFSFVRFGELQKVSAQEFLAKQLKQNGLIDDNTPATAGVLLSVNMAIFGNIGFSGECTWNYFMETKSHSSPTEARYNEVFDAFGVPHNYVKELMDLEGIYNKTKEQTLLQIFVPKDKVDEIAYLAWVLGIPAHEESMAWVAKNIKGKPRVGAITGPAIKKLKDIYAQEGEKNPKYKDLIARVEKGDFSVDAFLKVYCNKPWTLKNPNEISARLVLTPDILLNPDSGAKFFQYTTTDRALVQEYQTKLDNIVQRLVNDKKAAGNK